MNKKDVFNIYQTIKSDGNFVAFNNDGVPLNCYGDYLEQRGYIINEYFVGFRIGSAD